MLVTNGEKYLKDGVDINQLASEMCKEYYEDTSLTIPLLLCTFFDKEIKPTLTEDERVILKNIGEDCISLMRVDGVIYFHTEGKGIFPKLFLFIRERRRIFYKGAFK